jgi:hypothetical protein
VKGGVRRPLFNWALPTMLGILFGADLTISWAEGSADMFVWISDLLGIGIAIMLFRVLGSEQIVIELKSRTISLQAEHIRAQGERISLLTEQVDLLRRQVRIYNDAIKPKQGDK